MTTETQTHRESGESGGFPEERLAACKALRIGDVGIKGDEGEQSQYWIFSPHLPSSPHLLFLKAFRTAQPYSRLHENAAPSVSLCLCGQPSFLSGDNAR